MVSHKEPLGAKLKCRLTKGRRKLTYLKGQCHEIFCFWFFLWISFPPAPEYHIRTVSNFFENSLRYSQVKVHHRCQRQRWQICHRWQIIRTISGCRHLKVNLKTKCIYMLTLLPKGAQTKLLKFFCLKIFPFATLNLEPRIPPRILEKIRNGRNGILKCLGESDSWKKPEVENLVTLSL